MCPIPYTSGPVLLLCDRRLQAADSMPLLILSINLFITLSIILVICLFPCPQNSSRSIVTYIISLNGPIRGIVFIASYGPALSTIFKGR